MASSQPDHFFNPSGFLDGQGATGALNREIGGGNFANNLPEGSRNRGSFSQSDPYLNSFIDRSGAFSPQSQIGGNLANSQPEPFLNSVIDRSGLFTSQASAGSLNGAFDQTGFQTAQASAGGLTSQSGANNQLDLYHFEGNNANNQANNNAANSAELFNNFNNQLPRSGEGYRNLEVVGGRRGQSAGMSELANSFQNTLTGGSSSPIGGTEFLNAQRKSRSKLTITKTSSKKTKQGSKGLANTEAGAGSVNSEAGASTFNSEAGPGAFNSEAGAGAFNSEAGPGAFNSEAGAGSVNSETKAVNNPVVFGTGVSKSKII